MVIGVEMKHRLRLIFALKKEALAGGRPPGKKKGRN
jgi:hypothetical protein